MNNDPSEGFRIDSSPQADFLRAVWRNDPTDAEEAIRAGADPNGLDAETVFSQFTYTPLIIVACGWGSHDEAKPDRFELVEVLIRNGADVNVRGPSDGPTALYVAIMENQSRVIRLLLDHGADVNCRGEYGITALMQACEIDHYIPGLIPDLIARGAEINAVDEDGWTPLIHAVGSHNTAAVRDILPFGPDVSTCSIEDGNAFQMAVEDNCPPEIIEMLAPLSS